MRLLKVELKRFWSRRITLIAPGVFALLLVLGMGIAFTQSSADPPDPDYVPQPDAGCVEFTIEARAEGDPELADWSDDEIRENCTFEDNPDRRVWVTDLLSLNRSDDWSEARVAEEEFNGVAIPGTEYREAKRGFDSALPGIATMVLILAVVLGGSFVGAEYRAGTVENLLLWEPRRVKVILTKCLSGGIGAALVGCLLLMFFTGLFFLLASVRGTLEGADGRFVLDVVLLIARAMAVTALFFTLAVAIATLAKNTTAAVVAVLGWFIVSNIIIALVARWFQPFELFTNANAVIGGGEVSKTVKILGASEVNVFSHGPWTAFAIVALWALIPTTVAAFVFHRRDLT